VTVSVSMASGSSGGSPGSGVRLPSPTNRDIGLL
jgi:hypothetical protein